MESEFVSGEHAHDWVDKRERFSVLAGCIGHGGGRDGGCQSTLRRDLASRAPPREVRVLVIGIAYAQGITST